MTTPAHDPEGYFNRALEELARGDVDAAEPRCIALLQHFPDHPLVITALGDIAYLRARYALAKKHYQQSLRLDPRQPEALNNLGSTYQRLGQSKRALQAYSKAIDLRTSYADAYFNRGVTHEALEQFDQARKDYLLALEHQPHHADAQLNLGLLNLFFKKFKSGWEGYEWRWKSKTSERVSPLTTSPPWGGKRLRGGLLVHAEQGIGDQILHSGLIPSILERVGHLTLTADPRLVGLLRRSFEGITVSPVGAPLEPTDFEAEVSLASLGQFTRTDAADFMRGPPCYLAPDPCRIEHVRKILRTVPRPWRGLSWRSINPLIGNDKSLPLGLLLKAFKDSPGTWINLQYGDTEEEIGHLGTGKTKTLLTLPELDLFNDLEGLAALIMNLDEIITISNVTAHFAGALGKPTHLILPKISLSRQWYWHTEAGQSLWYPSVRVYQQTQKGHWLEPLKSIRRHLSDHPQPERP